MKETEIEDQVAAFSIAWSGDKLLVGRARDVIAIDAAGKLTRIAATKGAVTTLAVTPTKTVLAATSGSILVIDHKGKTTQKTTLRGQDPSLAASPDGSHFVAFSDDEGGAGKVMQIGTAKAVHAYARRYGISAWLDNRRFAVSHMPFRASVLELHDLDGSVAPLGSLKSQVLALAAVKGRLLAATPKGVVELDLAPRAAKAPTKVKVLLARPARGLAGTNDGVIAATDAGVYALALGKKPVHLSKTPAAKVAWRPGAIAFTQDVEDDEGDWSSRLFVLRG